MILQSSKVLVHDIDPDDTRSLPPWIGTQVCAGLNIFRPRMRRVKQRQLCQLELHFAEEKPNS